MNRASPRPEQGCVAAASKDRDARCARSSPCGPEGIALFNIRQSLRSLILVTCRLPNRAYCSARQRTESRLILGHRSPRLSVAFRPPLHRTRTVAWAAEARILQARLRKEGTRWSLFLSASTFRRIGSTSASGRATRLSASRATTRRGKRTACCAFPITLDGFAQKSGREIIRRRDHRSERM
jgi:hypothetical protein